MSKEELIEVFRDLIQEQRKDIKKKRCGLKDALYILDVSKETFRKLLKDPQSKIKKAGHGKYCLDSIYN